MVMNSKHEELLDNLRTIQETEETANLNDESWDTHQRMEAFESFLFSDEIGLSKFDFDDYTPMFKLIQKALEYSSIEGKEQAQNYLQENFSVIHVADNPLLQFMFYTLRSVCLIDDTFSLESSYLTESGVVFLELLTEYLDYSQPEIIGGK